MKHCRNCGRAINPPAGLTPTERDLMRVIVECFDRDGTTPSYRAMARELDIRSAENISRLVASLEAKGWIRRRPGNRNARSYCGLHILYRPPMPDFSTPEFVLADREAVTA